MSIVLVSLDSAPAQDPKAQEREVALDAKLESDMRELMRQAALESPTPFLSSNDLGLPGFGFVAPNVPPRSSLSLDINVLFSRLNADSYLPSLPPKTGFACKRAKAEEIFNKYKEEFEQMARERRRLNETAAAVGAQDEHGREGSLNSGKQLKKTGRVSSDDAEMSSAKSDTPQSSKKAESPEKKTQPPPASSPEKKSDM
jgi:hypothetical protein